MAKEFKLEVMPVPKRAAAGVYDLVVADFIQHVVDDPKVTIKSARVSIPAKKAKTAQIGLSKAVQVTGRKDVSVKMVNGELFLTKK